MNYTLELVFFLYYEGLTLEMDDDYGNTTELLRDNLNVKFDEKKYKLETEDFNDYISIIDLGFGKRTCEIKNNKAIFNKIDINCEITFVVGEEIAKLPREKLAKKLLKDIKFEFSNGNYDKEEPDVDILNIEEI